MSGIEVMIILTLELIKLAGLMIMLLIMGAFIVLFISELIKMAVRNIKKLMKKSGERRTM